jgi:hypothetical protein
MDNPGSISLSQSAKLQLFSRGLEVDEHTLARFLAGEQKGCSDLRAKCREGKTGASAFPLVCAVHDLLR